MFKNKLWVIHQPKRTDHGQTDYSTIEHRLAEVFYLDTCQRRLWLTTEEPGGFPLSTDFEVFQGMQAYEFLLRVSTGLESQVVGETDIFGQIKEAWRKFESDNPDATKELQPYMQVLFQDTKLVRKEYLHNLGGSSYGTLVRMLLGPVENQRLAIIGAGQLARSVAPFLLNCRQLLLTNRTQKHLESFYNELKNKAVDAALKPISDELEAVHLADALIICAPFDHEKEMARAAVWSQQNHNHGKKDERRKVLHLGLSGDVAGTPWETVPEFHTLRDLFALQKVQDDVRARKICAAGNAVSHLARIRTEEPVSKRVRQLARLA